MKALIGMILTEDCTIRDITLLASDRADRQRAHQLLFLIQDEIEKFEMAAKERIRSVSTTQRTNSTV